LIVCFTRKNKPPTPHKGGYDWVQAIPVRQLESQFFFDAKDLERAEKLYVAVMDMNKNEGRPRLNAVCHWCT